MQGNLVLNTNLSLPLPFPGITMRQCSSMEDKLQTIGAAFNLKWITVGLYKSIDLLFSTNLSLPLPFHGIAVRLCKGMEGNLFFLLNLSLLLHCPH